ACPTSPSEQSGPSGAGPLAAATNPHERDPYTRTWEIEIDGKRVGYLVEYQPLPPGSGIERALPEGSYRIQGPRFGDLGYSTPAGGVGRYRNGASSVSLGKWQRDDGLLQFFGGARRVNLKPLTLPAPAPTPATPPKTEGGKDEGAPKEEGKRADAKK